MKQFLVLLLLVASVAVCTTAFASALPADNTGKFTAEKLKQIEDNLIVCLASDCPGIRTSAALTLKQLKEIVPEYAFSRSIIPLMAVVNSEDYDENSRIVAALALYKLESDRGDYAIKWTGHFTGAPRVKHIYEALTYDREQSRLAAR